MMIDPGDRKEMTRYLQIAQVGSEMVVPAGIGAALDYYLGWTPWGVIVGAVLGLVTGLTHLVWLSNKTNSQESRAIPSDRKPGAD